jgi:hypothetical protein
VPPDGPDTEQCATCEGDGYVWSDVYDWGADTHRTQERPCPDCEARRYDDYLEGWRDDCDY